MLTFGVETEVPVTELVELALKLFRRLDDTYVGAVPGRLEVTGGMNMRSTSARLSSSLRNVERKFQKFFADFPTDPNGFPTSVFAGVGSMTHEPTTRLQLNVGELAGGRARSCMLSVHIVPGSTLIAEVTESFEWLVGQTSAYCGNVSEPGVFGLPDPLYSRSNSARIFGLVNLTEIVSESPGRSMMYETPRGQRFMFTSQIPFSEHSFVEAPQWNWRANEELDEPAVVERFSRKDLRSVRDDPM